MSASIVELWTARFGRSKARRRGLTVRERWAGLAVVVVVLALAGPASAAGGTLLRPPVSTLEPGQFQVVSVPLDVNVVLVGLDPGTGVRQLDVSRFLSALPSQSMPQIRDPAFYGITRDLGLHFTYRYHVTVASQPFDDAFFSFLARDGREGPPTLFQRLYDRQRAARRQIHSNLMIDAVDTERWLGQHSASIGVDTRRYTLLLINWYGRRDFRDHLYNKPGEPDPDTGISDALNDFGPGDAWGGTPADDPERPLGSLRRIWFYDTSAAVAGVDASWNLDDPAPSGGSPVSYRIPPIWEYGTTTGYRPFDDLTGDLAKIARYVAVDMLFTPSPLYDPSLGAAQLPSKINVELTGLSDLPGQQATDLVQGSIVADKLAEAEPYNQITYQAKARVLTGEELAVYTCFHSIFFTAGGTSCYNNPLDPSGFDDLNFWISDHLTSEFIDGRPDFDIPVALYDVPDRLGTGDFLGNTNDDLQTGLQTNITSWSSPGTVEREKPIDFPTPGDMTFTPGTGDRFTVAHAPATFDPAIGSDLHLGDDDSAEVQLPFGFPFLGTTYTSIFVNSNGSITLGAPDPHDTGRYLYQLASGPPRIAPLYTDLNPDAAGSVNAAVHAGSVVVTWSGVPQYGEPSSNTFQVILTADGGITFAYGRLSWPFGTIGVSAGNDHGPTTEVDFGRGDPSGLRAGTIFARYPQGTTLGPTHIVTHEVGHFIGLSHPHDGFDWETGVDFVPQGPFYFAWVGDYTDTVMSYLTQQTDFSQFDRDALNRDMTSVYINTSNSVLGDIYATGNAGLAATQIQSADREAAHAIADLQSLDYEPAARSGKAAYLDVLAAAAKVGVAPVAALHAGRNGQSATSSSRRVHHDGVKDLSALANASP
jgi:hypothetical protein